MLPGSVDATGDGKKSSHIDVWAQEKFRAEKDRTADLDGWLRA
jgi:hypothetical protein